MSLSYFAPAPRPFDERARQRAVDACGIHRAPPDPTLYRIVKKAAKLLEAPFAGLSIIDHDRLWFAVRIGIDVPGASRSISFCAHAILNPDRPMVIPDMLADDRFAGNPFVLSERGVRFYVGVPVLGVGRQPLGTLCVLDRRPRTEELPLPALVKLAERASQAIAEISCGELD